MLCALLASVPAGTAWAQDQRDTQIWAAMLGTASFDGALPDAGLSAWLDVHVRRADTGTVHILRPGLGWQPLAFLSVWAGYAWVPTFPDGSGDVQHEHRAWQQLILHHRTATRLALQSRTRFEQRFSEAGSDVGFRLRQFVRVGWDPFEDVPFGVVAWDELFLGLGSTTWGAPSGLDQNRLFAGFALPTKAWGRVEVGYLFLYLDRATDLFGHVVAVNLFLSVP